MPNSVVLEPIQANCFFLKRMRIFKLECLNGNNKINSFSVYDTELLVQSRFIPREFSEHLLNLCLIRLGIFAACCLSDSISWTHCLNLGAP